MRRALGLGAGVAAALVAGLLVYRLVDDRRAVHQSHTVAQAVRRVAKLSTVEMSLSNWQLRRDARDLFGFIPIRCEKTVAVFYRGKVAAGFDLETPGSVGLEIASSGGERRLRVRLPPPRILYTDVPAPEVVVADGSVCNRIGSEDYERLHTDARAAVQREALASGILRRAETHARTLIEEIARPLGYQTEVVIGAATVSVRAEGSP